MHNINPGAAIRQHTHLMESVYVHRGIHTVSDNDKEKIMKYLQSPTAYSYSTARWVRIKRGEYQGDIAWVIGVQPGTDVVEIGVVPRIESRTGKRERRDKGRGRARQVLFGAEHAVSAQRRGSLREGKYAGGWRVGDVEYLSNGLRVMNVAGIHYAEVYKAKAEELVMFTEAGIDTLNETNDAFLQVDERVVVVREERKGVEGIVKEKRSEIVRISYRKGDNASDEETADVRLGDVKRVFAEGDKAIVRLGDRKGVKGEVIDVEEDFLTIIEVVAKEEVRISNACISED